MRSVTAQRRLVWRTALASLFVLAVAACGGGGDESPVIADGLSAPRGLAVSASGDLLIAETGGGRILEYDGGDLREVATRLPASLDAGPGSNYPAGVSSLIANGDELHALVGEFRGEQFGRLYLISPDGSAVPITAPTSIDISAEGRFANPYDFVEAPEAGGWTVSDSGRNALLAVTSDGATRDYALFPPMTEPGRERGVEVVPTGIARGPDGALYVGSLTGYPYPEAKAWVWRVEDRNGDGDAMDDGETTRHMPGFTTITDIVFDSQGRLYVAEFTSDMLSAIDGGRIRENVSSYPGRILRVDGQERTVIVESAVSPTGLLVHDGYLYYSEEFAGSVTRVPLP